LTLPSDLSSAWTTKANKRVRLGYGHCYLIDIFSNRRGHRIRRSRANVRDFGFWRRYPTTSEQSDDDHQRPLLSAKEWQLANNVAAGTAPGESGVSVLNMRFRGGVYFGAIRGGLGAFGVTPWLLML
jgi:hypothetical protein